MKNKKKLLVLLLLLLLASATVVTTAFAKYSDSKSGSHSAQVAKWGVTFTAGTGTFKDTYNGSGDESVKATASTTYKLVAPGTTGTLDLIKVEGTPEVALNAGVTGTVSLTGWTVTEDKSGGSAGETETVFYCPVKFIIGSTTVDGTSATYHNQTRDAATNQAAMETAIANAISKTAANYPALTNLKTTMTLPESITWEWAFTGNDALDTQLGNAETAPSITITQTATATQLDTYATGD